jgi:hypothetical protein
MDQLVTANGATTALRGGSGPDLVLVHSLLTDRDAFQAVVPELAERFRVTLLNLSWISRVAANSRYGEGL